jgi:hypothetical protein
VPHQLHCNPPPLLDELDEDELEELDDELLLVDELELDELLLEEEPVPPQPLYTVAHCDVWAMPLEPLIRRLPQEDKLLGFQLITISSDVQQLPLPDHDQPIYPTPRCWA